MQYLIGFAFALLIALVAWLFKALSLSGAIAALILGTVVFGFGGLVWAIVLVLFFSTSSLLSLLHRKNRDATPNIQAPRRDAWQVLANGGAAVVFVLLHAIFPAELWTWVGFSTSLAAACADTWSTEIGMTSKKPPVSIITGKQVQPGESGGITFLGCLGGLGGASFIAFFAGILSPSQALLTMRFTFLFSMLLILTFGFLGTFIDSVIGGAWQVKYYCPVCNRATEKHPLHTCGNQTTYLSGIKWLDNNWVNGINTTLSGILAVLVLLLIRFIL